MGARRPVVLSGGSGRRLWPLSTSDLPKQFAPLLPGATLFERTLGRLAAIGDSVDPIVVTGGNQLHLVRESAAGMGIGLGPVIVEPEGRNTAPAALASALVADQGETLLILPSDHLILDEDGFGEAIDRAVSLASSGHVVTFGVVPTGPETGYGYIESAEELGDHGEGLRVRRFKEKPSVEEATRLIAEGDHLWNSGMFVVDAQTLLSEAQEHCPDLLAGVRASLRDPVDGVVALESSFGRLEKISLDHAIMEKTDRAAVVPLDVGWSDLGSFEALWAVEEKDRGGNAASGDVHLQDVSDSLIVSTSRTIAVAGMSGVVVVETPDAVLVIPRLLAQDVKGLAESVEED